MSTLESGLIVNLNDVLDVLATFLTRHGWTIYGNWREPVAMLKETTSNPAVFGYAWRYGRRLHANKGAVYITAQDYFYTMDRTYGTFHALGVGVYQGPGIALSIGTGWADAGFGAGTDAAHPIAGYNGTGPTHDIADWVNVANPPIAPGNGRARTFIMPLPNVVGQPNGDWHNTAWTLGDPLDHTMAEDPANPGMPAPFGTPGGAAKAMRYWLMCDDAGDNVMMVVDRSGVNAAPVSGTPYLYFGDLSATKGGAWVGGAYAGASLGNDSTYILTLDNANNVNRFAAPGAMTDNGTVPMVVRMTVDSFTGWAGLGNNADPNIGTGRSLASSGMVVPKPGDGNTLPFGLVDPGILAKTLRFRDSAMANGAPLLPLYLVAQRDNGNWSLAAILPGIYQANTNGIAIGKYDNTGATLTPVIYFDGFAYVGTLQMAENHLYRFKQPAPLADDRGGPSLVGPGAITTQGYHLLNANGFSVSAALADTGVYTIVLQVNFIDVHPPAGYGKIVDFKNLVTDDGIYQEDNGTPSADIYLQATHHVPVINTSSPNNLPANVIKHLVFTRDGAKNFRTYLDGALLAAQNFIDTGDDFKFTGPNGIMNLFISDVTGFEPVVEAYISGMALYDRALTAVEVAALGGI